MKFILTACFIFCMTTLSMAAEPVVTVHDGTVLTEDVTWRGSIFVAGSVVVAPQATLRIDPGTIIRFAPSAAHRPSNLVIQGRLNAGGTVERPVLMTSDRPRPVRGSWGGIVFLSTDKRNLLEHCRIEFAETGIEARYSSLTLKTVTIVQARTSLLSYDGTVHMTGSTISDSDTGIELYNSEFDGKDSVVESCQRGAVLKKSAVVLSALAFANNKQSGLESDECRIKITGGEFSANTLGARIKGGEGQITMTRFLRNTQTALHLSGSRVKITRCLFAGNLQDALRTEDGRALLLHNSFSTNVGFNLFNAGREVVSARQNWWGTTNTLQISQKIYDTARDKNIGAVVVFPWLNEKPPLMP